MSPRARISDKGRARKGRGKGHGRNYEPWIKVGDYPANVGFGDRVNGLISGRPTHTLSRLEFGEYLTLERWQDVVDIRENYPLPPGETKIVADRLGLRHPVERTTKQPKTLTIDLYLDILDNEGFLMHEAWDLKKKAHLALASYMRQIDIKEAYLAIYDTPYHIATENEIDPILIKNYFLLRRYTGEYFSAQHLAQINHLEKLLWQELKDSREPAAHVCTRIDIQQGYRQGTCLSTVYYLIYHRYWQVDLYEEIRPDEGPLKLYRLKAVED